MKELGVKEFRKVFRRLTEPVRVTSFGQEIGVYLPILGEDKRPEWVKYGIDEFKWKHKMNFAGRNKVRLDYNDKEKTFEEDTASN